jgi:hypothetical protein
LNISIQKKNDNIYKPPPHPSLLEVENVNVILGRFGLLCENNLAPNFSAKSDRKTSHNIMNKNCKTSFVNDVTESQVKAKQKKVLDVFRSFSLT